jgi:hypothetical protein
MEEVDDDIRRSPPSVVTQSISSLDWAAFRPDFDDDEVGDVPPLPFTWLPLPDVLCWWWSRAFRSLLLVDLVLEFGIEPLVRPPPGAVGDSDLARYDDDEPSLPVATWWSFLSTADDATAVAPLAEDDEVDVVDDDVEDLWPEPEAVDVGGGVGSLPMLLHVWARRASGLFFASNCKQKDNLKSFSI